MVSRSTRPARGDFWLVDFQPTSGSEQSGIRIDQVRVVAAERFIHDQPLGRLSQAAMTHVEDLFRVLFELP